MRDIRFKQETNVFNGDGLIGRIETESGYAPVLYVLEFNDFFNADDLRKIAEHMDALDDDND
jgi:hypothetical protein